MTLSDPQKHSRFRNLVRLGDLEGLKLFLATYDDVDPVGEYSISLRSASAKGHLHIVKYLVEEHGADPRSHDASAIRYAAYHGHLDVVEYLYSDKLWDYELEGIAAYAAQGVQPKVLLWLIQKGAKLPQGKDYSEVLEKAIDDDYPELVSYLVEL